MDVKSKYSELYTQVLEEHRRAFEIQDVGEIERLMSAIIDANRIFVMGVGREGIAARSFAMRLMHLGKEVHWIWDDTTPGMTAGDLFIVVSGPGQIGHIHYVAEKGKAAGAKLAVITGAPKQKTPQMADLVLFVPAQVYNGTDERCVPSVQPMGALFEQHCFVLFDIIIIMLEQTLNLDHAAMESRHRNIE